MIIINLFHVLFVSFLLLVLSNNLNEGAYILKYFTWLIAFFMVCFHLYRINQKLKRNE